MDLGPGVEQAHPLRRAVAGLLTDLEAAAGCSRVGLAVSDKEEILLGLVRLSQQVTALRLEVLAEAGDVAEQHAMRAPGAWLARETRQDPAAGRADSRLALALAQRWRRVGAAFAAGDLNHDQVRAIVTTLDDLPGGTDADVLSRAETTLVDLAASHNPGELRKLGWRILELIAPDVTDEREREALARAEARARLQTKLTMRRTGAGMIRISATVSALHGELLKTQLHAFLNPRRDHLDRPEEAGVEAPGPHGRLAPIDQALPPTGGSRYDSATGERVPYSHLLGHAFGALLERVDLTRLPVHGATAATLLVHLDYDRLRAGLAVATLGSGECSLSAGEARRLACNSRLIPAVLGGVSEVLDLGRAQRLFTPAQRTALEIQHPVCQADGCDIPAPWAEAHHLQHWERGQGPTDLGNGVLLCSYHHHRIHDPSYTHTWHHGSVRYRRRH